MINMWSLVLQGGENVEGLHVFGSQLEKTQKKVHQELLIMRTNASESAVPETGIGECIV